MGERIGKQGTDGNIGTQGEEVQDGDNYVMRTFIIDTHQILVGAANVGR